MNIFFFGQLKNKIINVKLKDGFHTLILVGTLQNAYTLIQYGEFLLIVGKCGNNRVIFQANLVVS